MSKKLWGITEEGTLDNQLLRMYVEKQDFIIGEELNLIFSKENISEEEFYFFSLSIPIKECEGLGFCLKIEGVNSDKIKWKYDIRSFGPGGGVGKKIYPGGIYIFSFNLFDYIDLSEVGSTVFTFYPVKEIEYTESKSIDSPTGSCRHLGYIELEPFRVFINMESELIETDIEVHPDKWNLNWFNMAQDKGVFSVWIREFPQDYSPDDVKQDTILMNGVLKPVDVKKVSEDGKDMMYIRFSKRDGISYIGYIRKGYRKKINISGQFKDNKWFYGEAEIEITGRDKDNRYLHIRNQEYLRDMLGDEEYEKVKNLD